MFDKLQLSISTNRIFQFCPSDFSFEVSNCFVFNFDNESIKWSELVLFRTDAFDIDSVAIFKIKTIETFRSEFNRIFNDENPSEMASNAGIAVPNLLIIFYSVCSLSSLLDIIFTATI